MLLAIILRLLDEEKFLRKSLTGYSEYCATVRFRLLPSVW
jgi:protein-S-isoprenylcysteine O-methyltransferase Ste14